MKHLEEDANSESHVAFATVQLDQVALSHTDAGVSSHDQITIFYVTILVTHPYTSFPDGIYYDFSALLVVPRLKLDTYLNDLRFMSSGNAVSSSQLMTRTPVCHALCQTRQLNSVVDVCYLRRSDQNISVETRCNH